MAKALCVVAALALACGPARPGGPVGSGPGGDGLEGSGGGSGGSDGGSGGSSGGSGTACLGSELLASLGRGHLLVGLSGSDAAAAAAPYDLRYLYLAGGLADGAGPCGRCDSGCKSAGASCANSAGCGWWGCWQWDQAPPGDYARGFVAKAKAAPRGAQIPMITYYELLQASGVPEGDAEVSKVSDREFMARYLADWRFLLQQIGGEVAFLHVEPDFWGYAAQRGVACSAIPAAVASASPVECAGLPETLAGLGRCMIAMARRHAPNAKVGLHASGWGTRVDVLSNRDPALDVAAEARELGTFLAGCGAGEADFVAADMTDRDAGYYETVMHRRTWWDATDATLPSFRQAFAWGRAVAEEVGRPILWWQTPVGDSAGTNVSMHYRDNRVDYLFAHLPELAAAHSIGVAFGAGQGDQTSPDTDGGNLARRASACGAAGGVTLFR